MASAQPFLGYPTKREAVVALYLQGLMPHMIVEKTGLTTGAVTGHISLHRRAQKAAGGAAPAPAATPAVKRPGRKTLAERAEANAARDTRGIWTPEKLEKARRLFGQTMLYIAEALEVPPKELLEYGLKGVLPPMGEGQRVAALLEDLSQERDDARSDAQSSSEFPALAPPAAAEAPTGGSGSAAAPGDPEAAAAEHPAGHPPPQPAAAEAPDLEPDRDDDEAELARLAALEDEDADIDDTTDPQPEQEDETGTAVAPPAPSPEPPRRYRLSNELGEFLHESGHGMTRNPRIAWSGTPIEIEALRRKKPQCKQLDEVPFR